MSAKSIKKGSRVRVLSGKDRGKSSTVIKVLTKKSMALVEGVNIKTNFDKKDGLLKKEAPIPFCKIQLV